MDEWNLVSSYTNEDGLADGTFVDISHIAKKVGFFLRFIVTNTIFELGEWEMTRLLIVGNSLVHSGQIEDGNLVKMEAQGKEVWLLIEGTCKEDAIFKMIFAEEY